MDIFKANLKYLASVGITPNHAMQRQLFSTKFLLQLLKFCLCIIFCGGFLVYKASNLKEYTESIYFTSACIANAVAFVAFAANMRYFFNFMDGWTICTEGSEYGWTNFWILNLIWKFYTIAKITRRITEPGIEKSLRGSQWTCEKTRSIYKFGCGKNNNTMSGVAEIHSLQLHLLHKRPRKRCIWIVTAYVVSQYLYSLSMFYSSIKQYFLKEFFPTLDPSK